MKHGMVLQNLQVVPISYLACVSKVLYICLCSRNSQYYYIFSVSLGKLFTFKGLEQLAC